MVIDAWHPAAREGHEKTAGCARSVEKSKRPGCTEFDSEEWKERIWKRENHRDEVDRVGAKEIPSTRRVAHALNNVMKRRLLCRVRERT